MTDARALAARLLNDAISAICGNGAAMQHAIEIIQSALAAARNEALEEVAKFSDSTAQDERLLAKSARGPILQADRAGMADAAEIISKHCRALKDRP